MADCCRTLSHALASSSGLRSAPRHLTTRFVAVPRPVAVRAPLRVCAVAGLARPAPESSSSAAAASQQLLQNSLNAPSAEELAAPVATVMMRCLPLC